MLWALVALVSSALHNLPFTSAVMATIALYWPMMLCVCVAAADRTRMKRAMRMGRAAPAAGIGAGMSGLLYVLNRGCPGEMIPNLPGMLVLGSLFVAYLALFRLVWQKSADA